MNKQRTYKRGDKVRIKKGTMIFERGGKQRIAGREYIVTVYRESSAWTASAHLVLNDRDYYGRLMAQSRGFELELLKNMQQNDREAFEEWQVTIEPARVVWSGKNGWCEANLGDVERVTE